MDYLRFLVIAIVACATFAVHPCLGRVPFVEYHPTPGVELRTVYVDERGVKWFGGVEPYPSPSYYFFVFVLRYDELSLDRFDPVRRQAEPFDDVCVLRLDSEERLWAATRYEVYYLDRSRLIPLRGPEGGPLFGDPELPRRKTLAFDGDGDMWVGWDDYSGGGQISRYVFGDDWQDGRGAIHYGNDWDGGESLAARDFRLAPDGSLWFTAQDYVYRVDIDHEIPIFNRVETGVGQEYPFLESALDISPEGHFWRTVDYMDYTVPPDQHFIQYSANGSDWERLDLPSALTSPAITVWLPCVSARDACNPCFGARFYGSHGAGKGLLWFNNHTWRWISLEPARPLDTGLHVAVDGTTGDVWAVSSEGAYVLRGGPDAWPPVWIELTAQEPETKAGEGPSRVTVEADVWLQMDLNLDVYVAAQDAIGTLYFAPGFGATMAPLAAGVEVPIGLTLEDFIVLTLDLSDIPEGTYRWYAACTNAGTTEFASNIASCEWQFVK